jgi:hypothetical protein
MLISSLMIIGNEHEKPEKLVLRSHFGFSGGIDCLFLVLAQWAAQASIGALRRNSGIGGGPLNLAKESH